jgi:hypothetical protein
MKYIVKHFDSTKFFSLTEACHEIAHTAYIPAHLNTVAEIKNYMTINYRNGRTVLIFYADEQESLGGIVESFVIGVSN